MHSVELNWSEGISFEVKQDGHTFMLDGSQEYGGKDKGPRPKALLLTALAGCTGMDVVSMLEKMKFSEFSFSLKVDAELNNEHPIVYTKATLYYIFKGKDLNVNNIKKAVKLSEEKYCGVSAMLRNSFPIKTVIIVNEEVINE